MIPPIGFTPIFTFRRVYLLFYISNYYVLTGNKAVMSKSAKDSLDLCLFWSETRYLMPVDKPAISKSQALEYCKVHTFSEYLAVHQVPSGRAKITLFPVPFSFIIFSVIFFRFLLVLYLYVAFFVISFFTQGVLVPWLQLFSHLVQKLKMAFEQLPVHRDQQGRDHLGYSLRYLTRYLILCYPLHCSTTPFRCLDFSADGNDSELP